MAEKDPNRPLLGLTVGISAAQSEDATDPGFHNDELNRSVVRITQRLLAAGARIVVGHDWRKGGIMETLLSSPAMEHAASIGKPGAWAITNLVPDGSAASSGFSEMEDYSQSGILHVQSVGMPVWWPDLLKRCPNANDETTRSAVSMMHLRDCMEELCSARLCIGGKTVGFSGFYPGILEEGWRSAKNGKPVYVTDLLGGASSLMAQASGWQGKARAAKFSESFKPAVKREPAYKTLTEAMKAEERKLLPDFDMLPFLSDLPLQARSGLTIAEWNLLINAPTADAVGVMVIRGLAKLKR